YADINGEPGTAPLLAYLRDHDQTRVLLPVQRTDGELDWAAYEGSKALAPGPHRISEPTGARLGLDAIGTANVLVVPALAIDRRGHRLGQGGGGYDRALARADAAALVVAVIYDEELFDEVPVEPHDVAVQAAVTPSGLLRFDRRE